jgi:hypothetical protein
MLGTLDIFRTNLPSKHLVITQRTHPDWKRCIQVVDSSLVASNTAFKDLSSAPFGFGVCNQARLQLNHCQVINWGQVAVLTHGTGSASVITGGVIEKCSKAALLCHDSATTKARALKVCKNAVSFMVAESATMRLFDCESEDPSPYSVHGNGQLFREGCSPAE